MINVLEMLEASACKYPDNYAFGDPDKEITFKDLLDKAQRIGSYFLSNNIIDKDCSKSAVAFYMEKCVDSVCAMFGGVYAGAFYCYIDTRQTPERVNHIISVANPSVIITNSENIDKLSEITSNQNIILIDDLFDKINKTEIDKALLSYVRSKFYDKKPLYVNFTSGSTGVPKGVAVGHSSVINFIDKFTEAFDITSEDIFANQAPFDFDVSVKDIYSGLYKGARVQLIPRSYFTNPTTLMDYLCEHKVTTLVWAVTAMCFVSIMNGFDYKNPDTIKKVMFSGEVMPVKQLNKWKKYLPDAMYVNLYGPTEITCNCTYHILDREYEKDEILPIGKAFKNSNVFLLDENNKLITAPNTEGELCVSGSSLALGYYKNPEKTAEAFVINPLIDEYNEIMYRTGDLARYDENGLLYYCSRKDHQIKHMGQRIELGDIEASAMAADGVTRACCLYEKKRSRIVLFYTGEITKEELSEALRNKLPQFMIPGKTNKLDEFPMNKNGKIDRNALSELI